MKNFWKLLVVTLSLALLAGCGGGGGGGGIIITGTVVAGRVVDLDALTGVQGIGVQLFDNAGNLVGSATTDVNGAYSIQPTVIPTRIHLLSSSINAGFYREYRFRGLWYLPSQSTCRAPLPPITSGVTNTLVNIFLPNAAGPPPPPPNGCS